MIPRDLLNTRARICVLMMFQRRGYFKPNDGVLPRRESRRTLSKTRNDLATSSGSNSRNILLPPYVSPGELRILLGIEYDSALSMCQVKLYQRKYYWSDLDGRCFENSNKRKILVPFEAIAPQVRLFGLNPIKVDPEPIIPIPPEKKRIPVVSIFSKPGTPLVETGAITVMPRPVSDTMMGRQIEHSDAVVLMGENLEDEFTINDFAYRFSVPILRIKSPEDLKSSVESLMANQTVEYDDPPGLVDPQAIKYRSEKNRTDILVDAEKHPQASAVVLDVLKSVETGKVGLVLVKRGHLRLGQNFVAGSGFGKITNLWTLKGDRVEVAFPGMLVKVGKLAKETGDFAPDDYLHVFPKERAWRIALHRERIEWLNASQTDGKRLPVSFELDSNLEGKTNFAEDVSEETPRAERIMYDDPVDYRKLSQQQFRGSILVEPEEVPPEELVAKKESAKVSRRWLRRQEMRALAEREKEELGKLRQIIHHSVASEDVPETPRELPKSLPVIPLIIKTESVSQFDAILDKIEELENEYNVKLPVVHGGIGPVTPNDLVHAEIESKFSPCPVYAVGTTVVSEAAQSSDCGDKVIEFKDVSDVFVAIKRRINRFKSVNERIKYSAKLQSSFRHPS